MNDNKESSFGKELRKLRVDLELTLGDLGEKLEKSAGFLSGIETGRRPVPPTFVDELQAKLRLDEDVVAKLEAAAEKSRKKAVVIGLEGKDEFTQRLVVAFARNVGDMSSRDRNNLMQFFAEIDNKKR